MDGTICPKPLDMMKRATGFSRCKNCNLTAIARATANVFDVDNYMNMHVSERYSVAFVVKCKNSIDKDKETHITTFIGHCECFGSGVGNDGIDAHINASEHQINSGAIS